MQVFDFNVTDSGVPYLVMELLEGKPLAQRIATAGALDPAAAVDIVDQIASALHAAHARGIVHRDLKPDNVMLLADAGVADFVKVLDFGISQASWRPRLTEGERVAGTPQYMAPEQACGLRDQIDHRSDQFSLAAIAYVAAHGARAVHAATIRSPSSTRSCTTIRRRRRSSSRRSAREIDAVIMRGLAKESADRYPNVLAFASALRAAVHGGARGGVHRSDQRAAAGADAGARPRDGTAAELPPPERDRRRTRRHPAGPASRSAGTRSA